MGSIDREVPVEDVVLVEECISVEGCCNVVVAELVVVAPAVTFDAGKYLGGSRFKISFHKLVIMSFVFFMSFVSFIQIQQPHSTLSTMAKTYPIVQLQTSGAQTLSLTATQGLGVAFLKASRPSL